MYIVDGDYIKDIEVNDLRNRYTLTKGATQEMVNTPCVNTPLIISDPSLYSIALLLASSPSFLSKCIICVEVLDAYQKARIARATHPSLASADSRCVTSRSRKKPELVCYTYNLLFNIEF